MLALVLVDALHLHVEHRVRVDRRCRCARARTCAKSRLLQRLISRQRMRNVRVVDERLDLAQPVEVREPAIADRLGDERGEARVREREPAARRHAVGLVRELLAATASAKSCSTSCFSSSRMQLRNAVHRVAADAGEVRHAHVALAGLVDEREARDARFVAEEAQPRLVEEARVDLVHDLEMPRQNLAEHRERPALQRFGQQRVIGVAEGLCA